MKSSLKFSLALVVTGLALLPLAAGADSEDAFCEVQENGETATGATGYCTITQHPDRVGIRLANGESFDLAPGEHAGRFHDQDGAGVDHKVKTDGSHTYAWKNRNITVYFNRAEGLYN
ncbi:MAG: hypothetical protein P8Y52_09255 [Xanthomonadales bacterium]